jgi:hypothetical protein
MALLSDPAQPQRFSLLAPDVAASIRQFQAMPVPAAPAQAPQRARVSGWRLLDRVLGGETVSEGLDAERARLQAEAERPQVQARMQAMRLAAERMGPEAMIAFNTNPEAFGESLGMQFRPVTTAAGSQTNYGPSPFAFRVEQPTFAESGDQTLRRSSAGVAPVYTRTAPSIKEGIDQSVAETGRINALNVPVGPNTDLVNPVSGQAIYQGYRAPDIQNVAPGGEALVFNDGVLSGRVASTQARPLSDADQTAIARADNQIVSLDTSLARAAAIEGQIARGELNLGVLENTGSGLRNLAGMSDQNSLNYDALLAWAKEARNAILQANTGVQTDQDAIRELDTILSSTRDERIVMAALRRFQEARSATRAALQRDIQRRQGGAAPVPSGGQAGPAASRRLSPQEAASLPPGTRFVGTDGVERVRQ